MTEKKKIRCAIYTRKSTEEGLDMEFNSLDAQREAAEAYIKSQQHEGWVCLSDRYDDGGFSGGNVERPALQRLLAAIEAGKIDCIVVYKVDRLSRSLFDFAQIMGKLEKHACSFVSVTQQFNTTHSMGRLTLNILLSFAQFEREISTERTRDKMSAARRKGKWTGGPPILGYDLPLNGGPLRVNAVEAAQVRQIYNTYLECRTLAETLRELRRRGISTKKRVPRKGKDVGGRPFDRALLHALLTNTLYTGRVCYKGEIYQGEHEAIVEEELFNQVQQQLRLNGNGIKASHRNGFGAVLRGLLHCGCCGSRMSHTYTVKGGNRVYRYYFCDNGRRNGLDHCPTLSVPAGEIERFVVEKIRAIGKNPKLVKMTLREVKAQQEKQKHTLGREKLELEKSLKQSAADIKKLLAKGNGKSAPQLADLNSRTEQAEARLQAVRKELSQMEANNVSEVEALAALEQFDAVWESLSIIERMRVLRLLIEKVDYNGEALGITFKPNGLKAFSEDEG